ncbi:MAG: citrate/2-methylcitrate synthase [Pseudomonadota bacterium]
MKEGELIDAAMACALLGVRPQTLYAYVSRSLLRAESDPQDARRSLYPRREVEALARRHRRPRARARVAAGAIRWGEPVMETAISGVREGVLYFGESPAHECAATMTLEEIAARHCGVPFLVTHPAHAVASGDTTPLRRTLDYLAARADEGAPMQDQRRREIAAEGAALLSGAAGAMLGAALDGPIHERFASAWRLDGRAAEAVRSALVLLSDHELNPSTFAVRVCASTGATLAAALLAGLATLTGPRHGGVAARAREALDAAAEGPAAIERFLAREAESDPYTFGFGHPLYPAGDPRAAYLLAREDPDNAVVAATRRLSRRLDLTPNIDAALAAISRIHGLPGHAAFAIFAIGRLTGWIAHAIEQSETGQIIRPRARYTPL